MSSHKNQDADAHYDSDEEPYILLGAYGDPINSLPATEEEKRQQTARARAGLQRIRESGVWNGAKRDAERCQPCEIGPTSKRNVIVPLRKLCIDPDTSGWREICTDRVDELTAVDQSTVRIPSAF